MASPARSRPRRRRRGRWLRRILGLFFLVGLVLAAFRFAHGPYFTVDGLNLTGLITLDEEEVLQWTGITEALPIWQIDAAAVVRNLEGHPRIRGAHLTREWPDKVTVSILERRPIAYTPYHGHWLAIDDAGVGYALEPGLPSGSVAIEGLSLEDHRLGDPLPPAAMGAVQCAAFISQYGLRWVEAVHIGDAGDLVLFLEGGVPARLGLYEPGLLTASGDGGPGGGGTGGGAPGGDKPGSGEPGSGEPEEGGSSLPADMPAAGAAMSRDGAGLYAQLAILNALWAEWEDDKDRLAYFDVSNPDRPAVKTKDAAGEGDAPGDGGSAAAGDGA